MIRRSTCRGTTRRDVLRTGAVALAAGLGGCVTGGPSSDDPAGRIRDALSGYRNVGDAIAAGYEMSTPYVRADDGVLGLPFINSGVEELAPETPKVLYYNVLEDGNFDLLGAEWLVPTESADEPPRMFGQEFHGPMAGHTEFLPEHYGLHAWPFGEGAGGLFSLYHSGATPPSFIGDLETAWEALSPYFTNETRAEEAGYRLTEQCVAGANGAFGVPVVNTDFAGTDLTEPAVLLYRLSSTWTYRLLGAEWYVPADAVDAPPSMFGREFDGPMESHFPDVGQPEHYGMHAWLFLANPDGTFAHANPAVRC